MENKKPLTLMSTDLHIQPNNVDIIKELVYQQICISKDLGIDTNLFLGDMVVSRQAQPSIVMEAIECILDIFNKNNINLIGIPGNHEKTNYKSFYSFLSPFRYHPAFTFFDMYDGTTIGDSYFHFLPFISEEIWIEMFNDIKLQKDKKNYLISHIGMEGSVNNDGSKQSSIIKPSMFKEFDKVFLGHFHNFQQLGKNIYHIPSIRPSNYGENNDKGVTVLYDDGSHETVHLDFKKYYTVKIDLTSTEKKDINDLKKKYADSYDNIRFKFVGNESTNKSLSKEEFQSVGIDVVTELKELQYEEQDYEVERLEKDGIKEEFKVWCEKEDKDYEVGKKYIHKKLK